MEREDGRVACGEERGGNADDDDEDDAEVGEGVEAVGAAKLFLAPHTGRAACCLPSMMPTRVLSRAQRWMKDVQLSI